jgi:hypothetical protein
MLLRPETPPERNLLSESLVVEHGTHFAAVDLAAEPLDCFDANERPTHLLSRGILISRLRIATELERSLKGVLKIPGTHYDELMVARVALARSAIVNQTDDQNSGTEVFHDSGGVDRDALVRRG